MLQDGRHSVEGLSGSQTAAPLQSKAAGPVLSASTSATGMRVLLSDKQSAARLNVSERTFHKIRVQPWMPKPIQLGPRLLRWVATELDEAVAQHMPRQAAPAIQPSQLLRGKIERAKRTGVLA